MKKSMKLLNHSSFWFSLGLGGAMGWMAGQFGWVYNKLSQIDVERSLAEHVNLGAKGFQTVENRETDSYTMTHTLEDGIERIVYTPKQRRFDTPILMQHGMWHGAWCWRWWQELLAEWGWESHAHSLPGHAGSPEQRPIRLCTLDYYLGFLKAEIERLPCKPVLMGHSMGGALTQWYLRYLGDDLPAAVLVAPWVAKSAIVDGFFLFWRLDPVGCMLMYRDWSATPLIRTPQSAAQALIGPDAILSPEELHAQLTPESALIMFQHNPPFWHPAEGVNTPMLWLAGVQDAVVSLRGQRKSAVHYLADYIQIPGAAHNLMMEHNYRQTADTIHGWLSGQGID